MNDHEKWMQWARQALRKPGPKRAWLYACVADCYAEDRQKCKAGRLYAKAGQLFVKEGSWLDAKDCFKRAGLEEKELSSKIEQIIASVEEDRAGASVCEVRAYAQVKEEQKDPIGQEIGKMLLYHKLHQIMPERYNDSLQEAKQWFAQQGFAKVAKFFQKRLEKYELSRLGYKQGGN